MEKFYKLCVLSGKDDLFFKLDNYSYEFIKSILRGRVQNDVLIKIKKERGKNKHDFLLLERSLVLLSDRIIELFKENNILGWKKYSVEFVDQEVLTSYYLLGVKGVAGEIINSKSEKKLVPPRVQGGNSMEKYMGLYFNMNKWDLSDIFIPENYDAIFVNEKVKQLIEVMNLPNVKLISQDDLENINARAEFERRPNVNKIPPPKI